MYAHCYVWKLGGKYFSDNYYKFYQNVLHVTETIMGDRKNHRGSDSLMDIFRNDSQFKKSTLNLNPISLIVDGMNHSVPVSK